MKSLRWTISSLAMLTALVAIQISSCSGSSSTGSGGGGGNNNPPPNQINIDNTNYIPKGTSVTVGTEITWVNLDSKAHTVTSDDGGFTSSATLMPNDTFKVTFNNAGSFPYHCNFHPGMMDTITVTP